jgi:hypothetical protein
MYAGVAHPVCPLSTEPVYPLLLAGPHDRSRHRRLARGHLAPATPGPGLWLPRLRVQLEATLGEEGLAALSDARRCRYTCGTVSMAR